jgi:hypothetical protein
VQGGGHLLTGHECSHLAPFSDRAAVFSEKGRTWRQVPSDYAGSTGHFGGRNLRSTRSSPDLRLASAPTGSRDLPRGATISTAPAPHVDGDPLWGLVRSRRRGPLPDANSWPTPRPRLMANGRIFACFARLAGVGPLDARREWPKKCLRSPVRGSDVVSLSLAARREAGRGLGLSLRLTEPARTRTRCRPRDSRK